MTTSEERRRLLEHLENKEFRDALVEADMANGILFQLKAMLEDRGLTQEELAEKAGTSQPVISKYLKGYENFSLKTLRKLASAFDVSFTSSFERFSDLAKRHLSVEWARLAIPDYANDVALRAPVWEYASTDISAPQTTIKFTTEQVDWAITHEALAYDFALIDETKPSQQKDENYGLFAA